MNNKELFRQFSESEKLPLFLRYSWFKAKYSDNDWDVAIEKNGDGVVGVLPYVVAKKKSFKIITPQFLSPYQGVWIKYPDGQKYASKIGFEKEVINGLIEQLPKVDAFKQNFLPGFSNWMPFNWKGFEQSTRYTYLIKDISENDKVFSDFKENIRRDIRKAEKSITVEVTEDIELMFQMKQHVYESKNDSYPIPLNKLKAVYNYCNENNCGELLMAKDADNNIHSIVLYVWDNESAYYLLE